jgi:thiamine kinase-like enzyme
MLSSADLALAARDPALPGLAIALNAEAVRDLLQPYLPNVGWELSPCLYVRYKPGASCIAAYRICIQDREIDLYVKAVRGNDFEKLQKWSLRPGFSDLLLKLPRIVLQDRALILGTFWNDTKLRQLNTLASDSSPQALHLWPDLLTEGGTWRSLRYKPERRYVTQWQGEHRTLLVKLYLPSDYDRAALAAQTFHSQGNLRIAKMVDADPSRHALCFEWLDGRLLQEILDNALEENELNHLFHQVGAALTLLHQTQANHLPVLGRSQEIEQLQNTAKLLSQIHPAIADLVNEIAHRGSKVLGTLPLHPAPIHGDFYAEQVVILADRIGILDLDRAAQGDPATDLGNFLAHLEYRTLLGSTSHSTNPLLQHAISPLLAGYGATPDLYQRVQWYTALNLFKLAPMLFRYRHPDWPYRLQQLLDRVKILGAGGWETLAVCQQSRGIR